MKDKRKMHPTAVKKRADFFLLQINRPAAKAMINKAIIISTTKTNWDTLGLDHREEAACIN